MTALVWMAAPLLLAGAIWLSWRLGVWGFLRVLRQRVDDLEDDVEYLRTRFQREDGRRGRRVQVATKSKEERELAALEEMAARERGRPRPANDEEPDFEEAS